MKLRWTVPILAPALAITLLLTGCSVVAQKKAPTDAPGGDPGRPSPAARPSPGDFVLKLYSYGAEVPDNGRVGGFGFQKNNPSQFKQNNLTTSTTPLGFTAPMTCSLTGISAWYGFGFNNQSEQAPYNGSQGDGPSIYYGGNSGVVPDGRQVGTLTCTSSIYSHTTHFEFYTDHTG